MTAVSRDRLVLECLLDGNASDTSGHGHHGVIHGAAPTTDRFGNPGGAFLFDGTDDVRWAGALCHRGQPRHESEHGGDHQRAR